MNIIDLRKKLQQSSTIERHISDRRKNSYSFGSSQWLEYMRDNNFECPDEDRRKVIRREEDINPTTEEPENTAPQTAYERIFLTPNERKLLQDIYLSDLD